MTTNLIIFLLITNLVLSIAIFIHSYGIWTNNRFIIKDFFNKYFK